MIEHAELVAVLVVLATVRLTFLVTADRITEPLRDAVLARVLGHGLIRVQRLTGEAQRPSTRYLRDIGDGLASVRCRCGYEQLTDVDPAAAADDTVRSMEQHVERCQEAMAGTDTWRARAAYLLRCPWCASIWVGAPVAGLTWWAWGPRWWWIIPALVLAASLVAGSWARVASPNGD